MSIIAIQDQAISTNNYKKHVLNDPNTTNDACSKSRETSDNIQHKTDACRALTPGDCTHRHHIVANKHCPQTSGYLMWILTRTTNAVL